MEVAKLEKFRGNVDYKKGDYASAIIKYTKALALASNGHPQLLTSILTNRAITYLHLKVINSYNNNSINVM
jgi:hypothetical protein